MYAGVDACKGGWVVAKSKTWPCRERPVMAICADFTSVIALTADCNRVAVDIPIGIPSGKQVRLCDREAKAFLQKNEHSPAAVFFTPPRESLSAENPAEFQKLHTTARKVGAGYPVWGIVSKIKQADEVMSPELQERVIEFHPELAWLRLARQNLTTKHDNEGIAERKKTLMKFVPELERILRWKDFLGRAAAIDDLLDALVGIGVARDSLRGSTYRLPNQVEEVDKKGLRMEIWY